MTKYIIFFKYIMKTIFKNTNFCFKNQSKLNISMIEKTTSPNVTFLSYSKIVFYICFYTAATGASTPAPTPSTTTSNRGLVFLYNITKDNINICQTGNLIFALARNNQDFAESVAAMVFQGLFVCLIFFSDPNLQVSDNRKYRISEWAGFQVWKFLHPQG